MSLRRLPPELQEVAENELNEKPNEIQENIRIIKEWMTKEPHLNARMDDQWIVTYLRGCKYSLETTKKKIDYYYQMRTTAPELVANRDPLSKELEEFLDKKIVLPLESNKKGPQYILIRLGVPDIDHMPLIKLVKFGLMMYDILVHENDYHILGQSFVVDLKGLNLSRLVELTVTQLKTILSTRHAFPCRIKQIIAFNVPSVAIKTIDIIKTMLNKKLANRIYIYPENNLDELYNCVPKSFFPKEYGGSACSNTITDYWKQKMKDSEKWFAEDAIYGTDEKKRIENLNTDLFGTDGSFRKLELD